MIFWRKRNEHETTDNRGAACALALMLSVSAFAMEVPTSTVVQNLNGVQQYIKFYTVPVDTDPQELIEEPFEYEGFVYSFADIIKQENDFQAQKEHTINLCWRRKHGEG